jgi:hypothetical protein
MPSNPWYYECHEPLPVEEIEPATFSYDIPRTREKQESELIKTEGDLHRDIERYLDLVENDEDALLEYDKSFYQPGSVLAIHTALSLKHNHISYNKGLIAALKKALGPEQGTLF